MSQAALAFDDTPLDSTGFEIGWDHARHRLVPPVQHLRAGNPVRQGWQAGQAVFGARTVRANRHVRRWLQLRLLAWSRGIAFEGQQVTPRLLAQIDAACCPVTREPLGRDACVERLFAGAGYAAGNLALLSPRACAARAGLRWSEALAVARRLERGAEAGGLDAAQWARLAVVTSFATPLAHAQVAGLPLVVLPPNRARLLNPAQALQALLTLQFLRAGAPRRMAELAAVVPAPARDAFQVFMHTLLARRIALATVESTALRHAMEDAWCQPLVQRRWQRLALQLSEADCERLVEYAGRRGLAGDGWRWLPRDAAIDGWALDSGGRAQARQSSSPRATRTSYSRSSMDITTSES
jgi:hypothetical protein